MTLKRQTDPERQKSVRARRTMRVGLAFGIVTLGGAMVAVPLASAQASTSTKETVVKVVDRAPYGKMLATVGGASLYTTASSCTGGCLQVWPPLLMAKGKTMPTGASDLTAMKVTIGTSHDLQVAYKGKRRYRFASDSGSSVRGIGVGGFKVASVG
jgi:predicted lipoprotein with Yx(FWY)xxD motif